MAFSMTGFGRGTFTGESFTLKAEVRAVNHRFLEIVFHLPRSLFQFEECLRQLISARLSRGKIDVTVYLGFLTPDAVRITLNTGLALGYYQALRELARCCRLPAKLTLDHFLRLPELFTVEQEVLPEEILWHGLTTAVEQALDELLAMRRKEGERLIADLLARTARVEELVAQI